MKKDILSKINYVIYTLLFASTILAIFFAYKKINTPFTYKFVIVYLFFLFSCLLYMVIITVINMKRINWIGSKKRLIHFLMWFAFLAVSKYITMFLFKLPSKGLWGDLSVPLGLSLGLTFCDVMFFIKKRK